MLNPPRLFQSAEAHVYFRRRQRRNDVRTRAALQHPDVDRRPARRITHRMKALNLPRHLKNRARAFFRLQPRVRGKPQSLDAKDTRPLPRGLHAATARGRLKHQRTARMPRRILYQRAARHTSYLLVTCQQQLQRTTRRDFKNTQSSQGHHDQRAIRLHIKNSRTINAPVLFAPGSLL